MRKKSTLLLITLAFIFVIAGCQKDENKSPKHNYRDEVREVDPIVLEEQERSFYYFWEAVNTDKESPGYGLIRDRYPNNPNLSSVAAVGFGLTAIPIGIENGWITYDEGKERVLGTLHTLESMERFHGFYYHFIHLDTAKRAGNSEVSVIDNALMISGALFAGKYFGGEIEALANQLYEEIDWNWYVDDKGKRC